jgi:hypothetical protein
LGVSGGVIFCFSSLFPMFSLNVLIKFSKCSQMSSPRLPPLYKTKKVKLRGAWLSVFATGGS